MERLLKHWLHNSLLNEHRHQPTVLYIRTNGEHLNMTLKVNGEHQPMAKQKESTWTRLWISMPNRFKKAYDRSKCFSMPNRFIWTNSPIKKESHYTTTIINPPCLKFLDYAKTASSELNLGTTETWTYHNHVYDWIGMWLKHVVDWINNHTEAYMRLNLGKTEAHSSTIKKPWNIYSEFQVLVQVGNL